MLKRRFGRGIGIAIPVVLMSATVLMAASAVPASAFSNANAIVTYNGKCFSDGGSTANSAPITQYTCNGSANQTWNAYRNLSDGTITFQNGHDMCLTDGGSTANSHPITQYKCNGSANQQWFTYFGTNSNGTTNYDYQSISSYSTDMCMTNGGSTANSAAITQYTCPPVPSDHNQWFAINP